MLGIAAAFAALKDPRRPNARHHKLLDILVIAFCASLCGAESCVDRAGFALSKEEGLWHLPRSGAQLSFSLRQNQRLALAELAALGPDSLGRAGLGSAFLAGTGSFEALSPETEQAPQ